jgi:hypothetical protein
MLLPPPCGRIETKRNKMLFPPSCRRKEPKEGKMLLPPPCGSREIKKETKQTREADPQPPETNGNNGCYSEDGGNGNKKENLTKGVEKDRTSTIALNFRV